MKLSITDRLVFGRVLPEQGDYKTLVIKKDIIDKVQIGQKEMDEIDFRRDGSSFKWDEKKAKDKDIEFTELETELIKEQLSELDKNKKLDDILFNIYKLFNS